jgi:hypothetical protein
VNKQLRSWEEQGMVELGRAHMILLDREFLGAISTLSNL